MSKNRGKKRGRMTKFPVMPDEFFKLHSTEQQTVQEVLDRKKADGIATGCLYSKYFIQENFTLCVLRKTKGGQEFYGMSKRHPADDPKGNVARIKTN